MIKTKILTDTDISDQWLNLFQVKNKKITLELFRDVVSKFINISASHFRKYFFVTQKVEKSKAHRKKVMEKKEKKTTFTHISINEIKTDKSNGKVISHYKLKSSVLSDPEFFNNKFYTKKQLQI